MNYEAKKAQVTFKLRDTMKRDLEKVANKNGKKTATYVHDLVEKHLKKEMK